MNGLSTINRMNNAASNRYDAKLDKAMTEHVAKIAKEKEEWDKKEAERREKTLAFLKGKTIASVVLVEPEDSDNATLTLIFTDKTELEISAVSECDNASLVLDSIAV